MRTVIEGAAVATVDAAGTEYTDGHVVVNGGLIESVGPGPAPDDLPADRRVDGRGCLATPGFVNTHHHLYQWATRGLAQQSDLFDWLVRLYPVWAGIDEETTRAAATAGLVRLARTGCTTAADHHYVFPRDAGDLLGATVHAAAEVGIRLHAVRGSMDRGTSTGGLPPDSLVEDTADALEGTGEAISRWHDPSPASFVRVAVGPCSPFSVSADLMTGAAELARAAGVRMHTHLAETLEEEKQCLSEFGCTPVQYAERLGWTGSDVWLAHGVHLSDGAIRTLGESRTGIAHCPSSNARLGAGIARVADMLAAGVPVGLGADGAASNEDGGLGGELRQAMYLARLRDGAASFDARRALWLATMGGAACLGRQRELGSLEPGKLADVALWRLTGVEHAGIADPVAALVFGSLPPLALLLAGGNAVIEDDESCLVTEADVARDLKTTSVKLARKAGMLR
ncbi:Cytosine/adenosine deaminase [Actinokineospora alba]|uniref:Cytosine/adenosine deaminase n=1 Tax=Actinokineospora alba TaxID=504798 RepID=A0A1H0TXE1_9PSEU|nr:8-oxoguanine deaminase [Actinokineospora alba]TDP70759.1 cytosine/adenosine deaminase-related metal-dependent hydrolase [Actinokineospora alba]SDJ15511.1 Cytosine/adenosine deaminase [Actinokineospora alba]SDP58338.1 Cytosine/adenosine deaminase [Actinokineospora alba]